MVILQLVVLKLYNCLRKLETAFVEWGEESAEESAAEESAEESHIRYRDNRLNRAAATLVSSLLAVDQRRLSLLAHPGQPEHGE